MTTYIVIDGAKPVDRNTVSIFDEFEEIDQEIYL